MIDDMQIIEAAQRAERIKAVMPQIGVSTDAIFNAIILGARRPGRPRTRPKVVVPAEPPAWFDEALVALKGQSMTIGNFMLHAGRFPVTRQDAYAIGKWLRASGRKPRKRNGDHIFDI